MCSWLEALRSLALGQKILCAATTHALARSRPSSRRIPKRSLRVTHQELSAHDREALVLSPWRHQKRFNKSWPWVKGKRWEGTKSTCNPSESLRCLSLTVMLRATAARRQPLPAMGQHPQRHPTTKAMVPATVRWASKGDPTKQGPRGPVATPTLAPAMARKAMVALLLGDWAACTDDHHYMAKCHFSLVMLQ